MEMIVNILLFLYSTLLFVCPFLSQVGSHRTFEIDYSNNTFLKDGIPFRYVSGSMHYYRIHPDYWQERLRKLRASGLNAVQGYVPWNVHEFEPGKFNWEGSSDLGHYLKLAQQEDLVVLLRLGPYIDALWDFGGFPAWLLSKELQIVLRSSDPAFLKWVDRWYSKLLSKIKPFLYKNGGPIIMLQIENEYGSYFACDKDYLLFLRNKVISMLGSDVVIYTTDGNVNSDVKCGSVKGVYATVDFGITNNASSAFKAQRNYEKHGPLINSEFYAGWHDYWGQPHAHVDSLKFSKSLDLLLSYKPYTNVNIYMFVGGTNFEYWNGAEAKPHVSTPTSYDFDSPVSDAGDITPKYFAIKDVVAKYLPRPSVPIPPNTNKTNYGTVNMEFVSTLQDALLFLTPEGPKYFKYPVPMESVQFYKGFILYRHTLKKDYITSTELFCNGVRDRAIVMVDGESLGILDRQNIKKMSITVTGLKGQHLDVLVENQGRVCFGAYINFNYKGLISNVTLGGEILTDWSLYPLHTENINASMIKSLQRSYLRFRHPLKSSRSSLMTPSIYAGTILHPDPDGMQDTFLDPRPFHKGQAFVNNFNLGRYWPLRGPQVRLYVPKPVFLPYPAVNHLYLFELEFAPCSENEPTNDCHVSLTDKPYLDGPNNPDGIQTNLSKIFNNHRFHPVH